jgi:hypothetical protein
MSAPLGVPSPGSAGGDRNLVCLQRDRVPFREAWLVVHEDVRRAPRVRAVMDILIEILARERELFEGAG